MKRLYLTIISTAFISAASYAQSVPGYLGKRWSVGYSAKTSVSYFNPTASQTPEPTGYYGEVVESIGINYEHSLKAEYVLSKKASVNANLIYGRSAIGLGFIDENGNNNDQVIISEFPKLTSLGLVLGYDVHSEHFAPLGGYFGYRLGYISLKTDDFNYQYERYQNIETQEVLLASEERTMASQSSGGLIAGISLGVKRVINDQIHLTLGTNLNAYVPGAILVLKGEGEGGLDYFNPDSAYNQELMMNMAHRRYTFKALWSFELGVSYLF